MTLPPMFLLLGASLFAVGDDLAPAVRDEAGLFSPETRNKAEKEIAALQDVYHLDMVIETVVAPSDGLRQKIAGMKPAQAALLLRAWTEVQAAQATDKGVYVWICKEPGDVEVVVSPAVMQREFTGYDANRLRLLLKNMKAGPTHIAQRDKRLLEAVVQTREAVRYNLRPPFPWLAVIGVLAGVLALWGVLSLMRRRLRAAEPAEPPRPNLFNALLGGMFGTVAAHWVIDTLFVAASRSSVALEEGRLRLAPIQAQPTVPESEATPETQLDRLDLAARDATAAPTRF